MRAGYLSVTGIEVSIIAVDQGHSDLRENTAPCAQGTQGFPGALHMVGIAEHQLTGSPQRREVLSF